MPNAVTLRYKGIFNFFRFPPTWWQIVLIIIRATCLALKPAGSVIVRANRPSTHLTATPSLALVPSLTLTQIQLQPSPNVVLHTVAQAFLPCPHPASQKPRCDVLPSCSMVLNASHLCVLLYLRYPDVCVPAVDCSFTSMSAGHAHNLNMLLALSGDFASRPVFRLLRSEPAGVGSSESWGHWCTGWRGRGNCGFQSSCHSAAPPCCSPCSQIHGSHHQDNRSLLEHKGTQVCVTS